MIAEHPLGGCGPGNFQDAYTAYKLPEASEEVADPHNFLLEVWATAGTPAMLALVALLASFAWSDADCPYFCGYRPVCPAQNGTGAFAPVDKAAPATAPGRCLPVSWLDSCWPCRWGRSPPPRPPWPPRCWGCRWPASACCCWRRGSATRLRLCPPAAWPAIGVAVMLVNLSAAGGIGQPGVAGSFWLLLALGAWTARGRARCRGRAAWSMLAAALALAAACYVTGYRPGSAAKQPCVAAEFALFNEHRRQRRPLRRCPTMNAARAEPLPGRRTLAAVGRP